MSMSGNNECCCELENELYAEILSYIIYDTRDLAKLRFISPKWNKDVLPFVLKTAGLIRNCYGNNDFIERLMEFGEDTMPSRIFDIDLDIPPLFEEVARIESITFPPPPNNYDTDTVSVVANGDLLFPQQARTLCETKSLAESETVSREAHASGMFFSIQQFEKKETAYCRDIPEEDMENIHSVILTCTVERDNCVVDKEHGSIILHGIGGVPTGDEEILPFDNNGDYRAYVTADIENDEKITCLVPLILKFSEDFVWDIRYESSSEILALTSLLSRHQEKLLVSEGVTVADGYVPNLLHNKLVNQINALADNTDADYHPHSNGIVRDLVHPALYSFVKGVSPQKTLPPVPPEVFTKWGNESLEKSDDLSEGMETSFEDEVSGSKDYWGRPYEASSKYQWLPTYFNISCDGTCSIQDYINNLVPRSKYETLYDSIAQLFSHALPLIESVFSYGKVVRPRIRDEGENDSMPENYFVDGLTPPIEEDYYSLRGKILQVITKIVDYELPPGGTYEGVWHVEGMSHEEIVATAIYFIDRDEDIVGGDILFKRAFHKEEGDFIFSHVDQTRPAHLERVIEDGLLPLGRVKTLSKRLLVFPNSHVHKVGELKNVSNSLQKRRIVVFFLVNPEKRIVSTREVLPQATECGGKMGREEAFEHRLALMKERKFTKQDWNIREIELCEH